MHDITWQLVIRKKKATRVWKGKICYTQCVVITWKRDFKFKSRLEIYFAQVLYTKP